MSDDSLLDFLTNRFDGLEKKVDDLAAVNARLAGHDDDIREIKDAMIRKEDRAISRAGVTWAKVGALACTLSALIYLAVQLVK